MKIARLFGALVVSGSLLGAGAGCGQDDDSESPDGSVQAAATDSGPGDEPDSSPAAADAGDSEVQECGFCPNEMCCEYDEDGVGHTVEGFECCWGTTC